VEGNASPSPLSQQSFPSSSSQQRSSLPCCHNNNNNLISGSNNLGGVDCLLSSPEDVAFLPFIDELRLTFVVCYAYLRSGDDMITVKKAPKPAPATEMAENTQMEKEKGFDSLDAMMFVYIYQYLKEARPALKRIKYPHAYNAGMDKDEDEEEEEEKQKRDSSDFPMKQPVVFVGGSKASSPDGGGGGGNNRHTSGGNNNDGVTQQHQHHHHPFKSAFNLLVKFWLGHCLRAWYSIKNTAYVVFAWVRYVLFFEGLNVEKKKGRGRREDGGGGDNDNNNNNNSGGGGGDDGDGGDTEGFIDLISELFPIIPLQFLLATFQRDPVRNEVYLQEKLLLWICVNTPLDILSLAEYSLIKTRPRNVNERREREEKERKKGRKMDEEIREERNEEIGLNE
jgi:hypothetical protein